MDTMICNKCGLQKDINEFELRSDTHKRRNTCKECRKKYLKVWHEDNKEYIKEYREKNKKRIQQKSREYYELNKEKLIIYSKEFRDSHKEYYSDYNKRYKSENKDYISEYNKKYLQENHDSIMSRRKQYYKENLSLINEKRRAYVKKRNENDELFKMKNQIRHLINHSLERKGYTKKSRTYEILGCDYDFFIDYLYKTYIDNYGVDWDGKEEVHIDHIIPLAVAESEEELIKLCHYTNLQLLKADDNIKKKDKLNWTLPDSKEN